MGKTSEEVYGQGFMMWMDGARHCQGGAPVVQACGPEAPDSEELTCFRQSLSGFHASETGRRCQLPARFMNEAGRVVRSCKREGSRNERPCHCSCRNQWQGLLLPPWLAPFLGGGGNSARERVAEVVCCRSGRELQNGLERGTGKGTLFLDR